jgi:hypothetical protein
MSAHPPSELPEALRLAEELDTTGRPGGLCGAAAAELRKVHGECEALREALRGLDEAYCRADSPLTRDERFEDRKRLIEEEGDPVAEVKRLIAQVDDFQEAAFKAEHEAPPHSTAGEVAAWRAGFSAGLLTAQVDEKMPFWPGLTGMRHMEECDVSGGETDTPPLPQGEKAPTTEQAFRAGFFMGASYKDADTCWENWSAANVPAAPPPPAAQPVAQDLLHCPRHGKTHYVDCSQCLDYLNARLAYAEAHMRQLASATPPPQPVALTDPICASSNTAECLKDALSNNRPLNTDQRSTLFSMVCETDKLTGALADDDSETQRVEVCNAWNDLPSGLKAHPGLKRLYRALGGGIPRPDGEAGEIGGAA